MPDLLSEDEKKEIASFAEWVPAVAKLWNEYNSKSEDPGARFYKSLTDAVNALSVELDSTHNGTYNKRKLLSSDSKEYKRIFDLLKNSKQIIEGLRKGKELLSSKPPIGQKNSNETSSGEQEDIISVSTEDSEMSFLDRVAEEEREKQKTKNK